MNQMLMKKILTILAFLSLALTAGAQTVFGIAGKWSKKQYPIESADVNGCLKAFTAAFPENSMLKALSGEAPSLECIRKKDYAKVRIESKEFAETEARFWDLPGGKKKFVIKMVNYDEDTLPRIYYFDVLPEEGRMAPARSPEGLFYGFIYNFIISPTGRDIEVQMTWRQSDHMVLQDDGSSVYEAFAPASLSCWVQDPDPSGITNIRSTPGGKVIGRLDKKKRFHSEDEGEEEEPFVVYSPSGGWWQILGFKYRGIDLSNGGWIHYSVLALSTRNYGGETLILRKEPSADAPEAASFKKEMLVRPMDISPDGEWVKVKCKAGTGWIEARWLCGNPYTNCS